MLKLKNVIKNFTLDGKLIPVLREINLEVFEGELIAIIGTSGAGKSTLLNIIGGLDEATSGDVEVCSTRIDKLSNNEIAKFRNKNIGFVFQFHHLLPEFTAVENVAIPLMIRGIPKSESIVKSLVYLDLVGLKDRANHKPNELSGGEQQRVAVARALSPEPKIILADEPSGNLDSENSNNLHELLRKICKENKQTVIVVTHNSELAGLADRVLKIVDGKFEKLN
ncbi:MAG: ABC transporter ATP-binding protein [Chlorobiota bacterium]|nr:ABC transporter ATP-binding protein [Chlorobiota bacterium]QQS67802.1 MAG: ABC transporter ATP-binding protein [Chlorobiota bacterium]